MPRTFRHRRGPSVSHPLALAAALVVACSPPTLPDPEVSSVDPARVWNGADIPVVVTGNNFLPQIDVDAGGYGTDLDDNWVVDLVGPSGRGSLAGVTVEDARHLLGVLPAGLTPGDYRVELTGPGGQFVASDEPLLEVSENQEVGLRVSYFDDPATTYAAGERVRFLFEAVGFDDEPVLTQESGCGTEEETFEGVLLMMLGLGLGRRRKRRQPDSVPTA